MSGILSVPPPLSSSLCLALSSASAPTPHRSTPRYTTRPPHPVVVIADAKQSHVEILQIAGRACRVHGDKPCGLVLIPVQGRFSEGGEGEGDGGGGAELEEGAFGTVINVLQTFREQVRGVGGW